MEVDKRKIIVRSTSSNLWWGIYGFCEKAGWEDLKLYYENDERICVVSLNTKAYLRAALEDLRKDPDLKDFTIAVEKYLADDKCHYWYYYDDRDDEDFYEVPFVTPKNEKGIKPRFFEIWHPDESIGLSTIRSAITAFASVHLGINDCVIEFRNIEAFDESLRSYNENEKLFESKSGVKISFDDDMINELSELWQKPREEVLKKLKQSIG